MSKVVEFEANSVLTSLPQKAFNGDSNLVSVINFPGGITTIPDNLFIGCTKLVSVDLSDIVRSMDIAVFGLCESLTSIGSNFSKIRSIGKQAFRGCNAFTGVLKLDIIRTIGTQAFRRTVGEIGFSVENIPNDMEISLVDLAE